MEAVGLVGIVVLAWLAGGITIVVLVLRRLIADDSPEPEEPPYTGVERRRATRGRPDRSGNHPGY